MASAQRSRASRSPRPATRLGPRRELVGVQRLCGIFVGGLQRGVRQVEGARRGEQRKVVVRLVGRQDDVAGAAEVQVAAAARRAALQGGRKALGGRGELSVTREWLRRWRAQRMICSARGGRVRSSRRRRRARAWRARAGGAAAAQAKQRRRRCTQAAEAAARAAARRRARQRAAARAPRGCACGRATRGSGAEEGRAVARSRARC